MFIFILRLINFISKSLYSIYDSNRNKVYPKEPKEIKNRKLYLKYDSIYFD